MESAVMPYLFYLFAFIIIVAAIMVVSLRNIFHCALMLILCLFGVAALYLLLQADFTRAMIRLLGKNDPTQRQRAARAMLAASRSTGWHVPVVRSLIGCSNPRRSKIRHREPQRHRRTRERCAYLERGWVRKRRAAGFASFGRTF